MPFYEYECSACKFYVESLQKISDPPLKKCPSCGKETMQRLISAPVFRLKGSGWYETDFKSDKENKRNLVDTAADDKEPAAASSDSDDKKVKVRASKALKKVAAKKVGQKVGKKAVGKANKPKPQSKATKPAAKAAKKPVKKVAKKAPAKKKAAKKVAKKAVKKAAARKK
jgi:putative FmdB family regulatory protein